MIKLNLYMMLASRKISQKELAEATNIRQATISSYCNNDFKHIVVSHLDKICYALNCTPNNIIYYEKSEMEDVVELTQKPMDMIKEFNEKYGDIEHVNHPNKLNSTAFMNCFTIEEVKKDLIQNILRDVRKSITADMLQEITNDVMLEMNEYFSQYKKEFDISSKPLTKDEISHSIIDKIKSNVGDGIK